MKKLRYFLTVGMIAAQLASFGFAQELTYSDHWDGEEYEQNSSLQHKWASSYLKKLNIKGDEKILDLGCGDGRITAALAKEIPNGKVVGVDFSDSMLAKAQHLLDQSALKNLSFQKQSATHLDFNSEFDLVLSFSCLHWVSDHRAALKGIERALKPGGHMFLYFAPDFGKDRLDHAIDLVIEQSKWKPFFKDFSSPFYLATPQQFLSYVDQSDLTFKRMEIVNIEEVFHNRADFASWIKAWIPHRLRLPEELQDDFIADVINHYLIKHPTDAQGNIHYIDYFMEVEAMKA